MEQIEVKLSNFKKKEKVMTKEEAIDILRLSPIYPQLDFKDRENLVEEFIFLYEGGNLPSEKTTSLVELSFSH